MCSFDRKFDDDEGRPISRRWVVCRSYINVSVPKLRPVPSLSENWSSVPDCIVDCWASQVGVWVGTGGLRRREMPS